MAARLTAYVVVAIVAATLIAGLIVGAQRDDTDGPVDVIIHNAVVYTADGRHSTAEAVAIRGNQILRVGSERDMMRLRRPQTTMIDAHRGSVLPGFNDSHLHFIKGGLDLERVRSDRRRRRLTRSSSASGSGPRHTPTHRGSSDADGTCTPFARPADAPAARRGRAAIGRFSSLSQTATRRG